MDSTAIKIQGDDKEAFRILFDEFYPALCSFAYNYLKDSELAADVVQETFVKLWDRRSDFDADYKIKSFLYIVVKHACLNELRNNRNLRSLDHGINPESEIFFRNNLIEEETYRIFYSALDSLPPQTKQVMLFALDGLKNAEIAKEMNIAESTVHTHKLLAYRKLKELLKDHYYLFCIFIEIGRRFE